jgi:hypothetical protein
MTITIMGVPVIQAEEAIAAEADRGGNRADQKTCFAMDVS